MISAGQIESFRAGSDAVGDDPGFLEEKHESAGSSTIIVNQKHTHLTYLTTLARSLVGDYPRPEKAQF
jgi:hypothetical protein